MLEKLCIAGQYSALSWEKRYNFAKAQYQVMVNDIAPGLISPEQSGMAFDAALFEVGGGAVGGAIKGLKGIKTVKLGSGVGNATGVVEEVVKDSKALKAVDCASDAAKAAKTVEGGLKTVGEGHNVVNYAKYKEVLRTTEAANPLVDSLKTTGQLPSNYVTKAEAQAAGWKPGKALNNSVPGAQIGGDVFQNTTGVVPNASGRVWYEADVGLSSTMSRLLYSNDGLMYITYDHYETVYSIGTWK